MSDPTTIYCNNLSIIQLAKNPVFHAQTKHIEVHYHFVRKRVLFDEVELTYVRRIGKTLKKPIADLRKSPKVDMWKKELKPAKHGGDEANKGEKAKTETWYNVVKAVKTKDELEIANSNESGNRSEAANSVRMFDSGTPNQLKAKRKKGQQKRHQHRDNKGAEKGRTSRQADQKG